MGHVHNFKGMILLVESNHYDYFYCFVREGLQVVGRGQSSEEEYMGSNCSPLLSSYVALNKLFAFLYFIYL